MPLKSTFQIAESPIKGLLTVLVLILPLQTFADHDVAGESPSEQKESVPDPLIVKALTKFEKKMDCQFTIPFPVEFDIDLYQKRPIALIPINGSKVSVTRPMVNPYDQPNTVELMIGPENIKNILTQGLECSFDLDERGEFATLNILVDWAADGTGNHQLLRGDTESGPDFYERAILTYRKRAAKANDPVMTGLLLSAFQKIATTIQMLRKEEHAG